MARTRTQIYSNHHPTKAKTMIFNLYKKVFCDNCGEQYLVNKLDPFEDKFIHSVCTTCFMPMKVKNPFYQDNKND